MAVYTDITEDQLHAFLAAYDIGGLLSYKGIAEGVENSNFLIHAEGGNFILTLYEKRVDAADLPYFLGLMEHLARNGLSCPQPVHRSDGAVLGELAGRPAAMVTFLEGVWMRRPRTAHCAEVGAALARMHLAGRDFPLTRRNALTLQDWRPLWQQCLAANSDMAPEFIAEVEGFLVELEARWPRDLPQGNIHADLFPDNVFFLGDELTGIIDFYFACTDALAYDVAVCLNAWCFEPDHAFNLTKGRALLNGYRSVRALTAPEVDALTTLAGGAALRFMLTRLYDWVTTPEGSLVVKKDPDEYIRKMRFHRTVASAREYGLDM
ncbi:MULTISPECIES: homoserine kinase [unclassified Roseitalea]|uniref:homoserine kinase n=1 Tax=unclassified Roseitalea TaxID=2639107 RepID=UPI00273FEA2C|nr:MULTISPECIES: homoserine kinase [unclassified Roseitalea]